MSFFFFYGTHHGPVYCLPLPPFISLCWRQCSRIILWVNLQINSTKHQVAPPELAAETLQCGFRSRDI